MKVKSIYLDNVRGLPLIPLDFSDRITKQIRPRTVIAGSNGSGKTTILDTICVLMNLIVTKPEEPLGKWLTPNQVRVKLELDDMPALSHPDERKRIPPGWPLVVALGPESWLSQIEAPYQISITGDAPTNWRYFRSDEPGSTISLSWPVRREWMEAERPTTLYFPSERRELVAKRKGEILAEGREHEWVWRFSDSEKWEGSLESFLVAMYFRDLMAKREDQKDTGEFCQFLTVINRFLEGKQIVGIDRESFRVQVKADSGEKFSIDELSSGEKQVILVLGEIQRRISKGSVVLIDEPEIHLHPQWQRLLVQALTDLCATYKAQLIITTHSEETANAVYEHELILLDAVFEQEPTR
jgi:predicted ATPase